MLLASWPLITPEARLPKVAGQQGMGLGWSRVDSWNSEKLSEILTPGGRTPNMVTDVCFSLSAVTGE